MELLRPSLEEGFAVQAKNIALDYIGKRGSTEGVTKDARWGVCWCVRCMHQPPSLHTGYSTPRRFYRKRYLACVVGQLPTNTLTRPWLQVLPHVGIGEFSEDKKAFFLGYVVHRLLKTVLGRRKQVPRPTRRHPYLTFEQQDDRDNLALKRLDLAGPLLGSLFRQLFKRLRGELKRQACRSTLIPLNTPLP